MRTVVSLGPDAPQDPEFTRIAHHRADLKILAAMVERVFGWLAEHPRPPREKLPLPHPQGLELALLANRPDLLASAAPLTLVGFFGQRRSEVAADRRQALWDIDARLTDEVKDHPGIVSLACQELDDGNYANLVLLADQQALDHWRESVTHQSAVREHAPAYYESIRIHNGTLDREVLIVNRTKYYAFGPQPWFSQREFHPPLTARSSRSKPLLGLEH